MDEKLAQSKTRLLIQQPFFSIILYKKMKLKEEKGIPTAATDGRNIYWNPAYFEDKSLNNCVFALTHEVSHGMYNHMSRMHAYEAQGHLNGLPFIPEVFNIAADYYINYTLKHGGIGEIHPDWLYNAKYDTSWAPEDIYADIFKQAKQRAEQQGKSGGYCQDGDSGGKGKVSREDIAKAAREQHGVPQDEHKYKGKPGEPPTDNETSDFKQVVAAAYEAAKAAGKMPATIEKFVEELLDPQIRWQEYVAKHVISKIGREANSWSRPRRKHWAILGEYFPSRVGYAPGRVVLAFDFSGSVSTQERQHFMAECQEIAMVTKPKELIFIWCDTAIADVKRLEHDQIASFDVINDAPMPIGGGGTSFKPVFKWLEDNNITPDSFVYFTDGYPDKWPDKPPFDTLWCVTSPNVEAPYGTTVHVRAD